jgi:2-polyprenyl-3-methyl-5-hydroxy-6-metoxy-1,4-benzoquinol methylase
MKKLIVNTLKRSGFSIVRVPRSRKGTPTLYSRAEITELERDLDGLRATGKDYNGWDNRAAVRKYLTDERINFYHELIAICGEKGVDFTGKRILDSGTCTGYLLRVLGRSFGGCSLAGCDMQDMFVNLASSLVPGAQIFKGNVLEMKTAHPYDIIFCTEVLEHIADTETPIPTILNLLASTGTLILTVPNGRYDTSPVGRQFEDGVSYTGHVNFWSEESWAFYIRRITAPCRVITGTLAGDNKLFAIIRKG